MQSLYQTIKEILETGRVGVPVFARCAVQIRPEDERVGNVLAKVLTMACSWLEASPLRIYAQFKGASQLTATIQYVGGQTAIVSVNSTPGAATSLDLMLLGNKGALYHDGAALTPGFDITAEPAPVPEWLMKAVERSLRSGKPTIIKEVVGFD